jgi:hypothetical protein
MSVRYDRGVSERIDPASHPAAGLLDAIGGAERIRSVRSFIRETIRVERGGLREPEAAARVTTYRAAGGRIRIETRPLSEGGARGPHPEILIVPPAETPRAAAALREARFEPRNVLAHLHEPRAALRSKANGEIEIDLIDEEVSFFFAPADRLCSLRIDRRTGDETSFLDWRSVAGIATPFREIRLSGSGAIEEQLVSVAYDLPLPDSLFAPPGAPG